MTKRVHVYPRQSAMHGAVEITMRRGYLVVWLPFLTPRGSHPLGWYWSPDATPSHSAAFGSLARAL